MSKTLRFLVSKKALIVYAGILVFVLFFFMLPLLIGIILAVWLYKNDSGSSKKRALFKASLAFIVGIFLTNPWMKALDLDTTPKGKTTQIENTTPQVASITTEDTLEEEIVQGDKATLTRVIDGDTIEVSINGKNESVRIIGINTPETVDPRKSVECFGEEASQKAKDYFNDKPSEILLESDPSQGDRDKYDRLLRYVWTDGGRFDFGKMMISEGYAFEYTYDTAYKYQESYKEEQKKAESGKKGLWADDACTKNTPTPTSKPTATKVQSKPTVYITPQPTSSGSTSGYSCNGPDLDCSDFSTHAQAQAFFDGCGFTATYDPHRLDSVGVGDGVACESLP